MSTEATTISTSERTVRPAPFLNRKVLVIELRRVLRNRRTLIFTLIFPVVMFFFISTSIPADQQSMGTGVLANVSAWVMVSMAVYGAVMASTGAGASVSIERASGWSRQLRLAPLRPTSYILTKMIAALVLGAVATGVTFASGALSGKAVAPAQPWVVCGVVIPVGSLAFAPSAWRTTRPGTPRPRCSPTKGSAPRRPAGTTPSRSRCGGQVQRRVPGVWLVAPPTQRARVPLWAWRDHHTRRGGQRTCRIGLYPSRRFGTSRQLVDLLNLAPVLSVDRP